MAISIDDILSKEFQFKGQGYDSSEVDQFLDDIIAQMEDYENQIKVLQEKELTLTNDLNQSQQTITNLTTELKEANNKQADTVVEPAYVSEPVKETPAFSQTASSIEMMLTNMQRFIDEEKNKATQEATKIVYEANLEKSTLLDDISNEKEQLKNEIETLTQTKINCQNNLKSIIEDIKTIIED